MRAGVTLFAEGDGFVIDCRKEHSYRTRGDRWVHSDLHIAGGPADYWYRKCFEGRSRCSTVPCQESISRCWNIFWPSGLPRMHGGN